MKKKNMIIRILLVLALTLALTSVCSAESYSFKGSCDFDGKDISSDFAQDSLAQQISTLEPNDDLTYTVTYKNSSKKGSNWYMKADVLKTLEENSAASGGGYTFILQNIGPDGTVTDLYNSEKVGGENSQSGIPEGLKQVAGSTKEWFFIQKLGAGQSGNTKLYIKFDGESGVNDYMTTAGALQLSYAVDTPTQKEVIKVIKDPATKTQTGDSANLLLPILLMCAALLALILALLTIRRDRRKEKGGDEA